MNAAQRVPMAPLEMPIHEWASNPTPESARLLIRAYRESEWRTTRLEVLHCLGKFNDLRSFLFLVDCVRNQKDLAEQMEAIRALSQRRTGSVVAFLREFFKKAPDPLKGTVAYALGQLQDEWMIPVLLEEWDRALDSQEGLYLKNLVIAMGEIKAFEALPKMRDLMARAAGLEPDLSVACLFAMARLERDPISLTQWESLFQRDSLQLQIYQSALAQVNIRSQFKLEDYLSKIFHSPQPHRVLPYELRAFDESEVELGLGVFDAKKQPKRYLFALQGIRSLTRGRLLREWLRDTIENGGLQESEWSELIPEIGVLLNSEVLAQVREEIQSLREPASVEMQLKWLEILAPHDDIESQGRAFLVGQEDSIAIRYLNLWSEWAIVKGVKSKTVEEWLDECELRPMVFARLIRACAELDHRLNHFAHPKNWPLDFKQPGLCSSVLFYFEYHPSLLDLKELLNQVLLLTQLERESLGQRILAVLESYAEWCAQNQKSLLGETRFVDLLQLYCGHFSPEIQIGVLKVLRYQPVPTLESWATQQLKSSHGRVEINAIITLKSYPHSREASEALIDKLSSAILSVQGRALDTLCAHSSLLARRAVIEFLSNHLEQETVVDKVYRSFDPERRGGIEFVEKINRMLQVHPEHPQWEKLVSLRDRLSSQGGAGSSLDAASQAELDRIDQKLMKLIPGFRTLDRMTQSALRAAEQPFLEEDQHLLPVDKAPTVLEYCKALDLVLERQLGQKFLFPKLDTQLHDFQTLWHRVGFGEDYPHLDRVITSLGLQGRIAPEHFPLHKAKLMCGSFFNGKVLQDRFKIFDGLRAWAVIFLIFARTLPVSARQKPLLQLPSAGDDKCISIAKRLMVLQDLRNPAAHRQTYMDLASVSAVRDEAILLLNIVLDVLK